MKLVVDASVAVKWFLPESSREQDADRATALLLAVREGLVDLLQPPHWLAEVAAVITRLRPEIAAEAIDLLDAMEIETTADAELYKRASDLAKQLKTCSTGVCAPRKSIAALGNYVPKTCVSIASSEGRCSNIGIPESSM